jgi:hypothetical protein
MSSPYSVGPSSDFKTYYVSGPSTRAAPCAFEYNGGTLDPESRFDTSEQAAKAARLCNLAFNSGYAIAMADIRRMLSSTEAPE